MVAKTQQQITEFSLVESSSGEFSLLLYFTEPSAVNLEDSWLENISDLPATMQAQLEAVDAILTHCKQQGLCHHEAMVVLRGPLFFDPTLGTYANVYVHRAPEQLTMRLSSSPAQFESVDFQAGSAVVTIHGATENSYQQQLVQLLRAAGIVEKKAQFNVGQGSLRAH
jgi:hypothetical protein